MSSPTSRPRRSIALPWRKRGRTGVEHHYRGVDGTEGPSELSLTRDRCQRVTLVSGSDVDRRAGSTLTCVLPSRDDSIALCDGERLPRAAP